MIMLILVHLSSNEIINCKECGQRFDTVDALNEHEKSEKEEKELQNKGTLNYKRLDQ
jgi:predicted nucleic acid-binding Zn ribbon protein